MLDLNAETKPLTDHEKKVDLVYEQWAAYHRKRLEVTDLCGVVRRLIELVP